MTIITWILNTVILSYKDILSTIIVSVNKQLIFFPPNWSFGLYLHWWIILTIITRWRHGRVALLRTAWVGLLRYWCRVALLRTAWLGLLSYWCRVALLRTAWVGLLRYWCRVALLNHDWVSLWTVGHVLAWDNDGAGLGRDCWSNVNSWLLQLVKNDIEHIYLYFDGVLWKRQYLNTYIGNHIPQTRQAF